MKVLKKGTYEIEVRRWPAESGVAINKSLPPGANVPGASQAFRATQGVAIGAEKATLRINGKDLETKSVASNQAAVTFTVELKKGKHRLSPFFHVPNGELGAYYTIITTQ